MKVIFIFLCRNQRNYNFWSIFHYSQLCYIFKLSFIMALKCVKLNEVSLYSFELIIAIIPVIQLNNIVTVKNSIERLMCLWSHARHLHLDQVILDINLLIDYLICISVWVDLLDPLPLKWWLMLILIIEVGCVWSDWEMLKLVFELKGLFSLLWGLKICLERDIGLFITLKVDSPFFLQELLICLLLIIGNDWVSSGWHFTLTRIVS